MNLVSKSYDDVSMTLRSNFAIQVKNLTKSYPIGSNLMDEMRSSPRERMKPALQEVSLEVKPGEVCALMGPNAGGKTTLIKILCGLVLPDQGEVRIQGVDMLISPEKGKALLGLVSAEESGFYARLSGRRNLDFFGALYGYSGKERRLKIEETAEILQIHYLDQCYQEYSTGMKRWLGLARALMRKPSVLIMDEPTRSLDPEAAGRFHALIRQRFGQKQNMTIFFSTHQALEAEALADRIVILIRGRVAVQGNPAVLCAQDPGPAVSMEEVYLKIAGKAP